MTKSCSSTVNIHRLYLANTGFESLSFLRGQFWDAGNSWLWRNFQHLDSHVFILNKLSANAPIFNQTANSRTAITIITAENTVYSVRLSRNKLAELRATVWHCECSPPALNRPCKKYSFNSTIFPVSGLIIINLSCSPCFLNLKIPSENDNLLNKLLFHPAIILTQFDRWAPLTSSFVDHGATVRFLVGLWLRSLQ